MKKETRKPVLCVRNRGPSADLIFRKVYRRLPDHKAERRGMIRIVDESGEDYLYPREWFRPFRFISWRHALRGA